MAVEQSCCFSFQFYIKPQRLLHIKDVNQSCFSFQFYIKPQRLRFAIGPQTSCFSFQFYIKPQLWQTTGAQCGVVSHSNSTSNHNHFLIEDL